MNIAVMSDTHDHVWNMQKALISIQEHHVDIIIHLGDLVSPFMLEELDIFSGTMHLVLGNNPGDQVLLMKKVEQMGGKVVHHGMFGKLELGGRRIAFIHDPHIAFALAKSGEYDVCLCGHTHRWRTEWIGKTLLLNPGEVLGKKETPGWALLDLEGPSAERILI